MADPADQVTEFVRRYFASRVDAGATKRSIADELGITPAWVTPIMFPDRYGSRRVGPKLVEAFAAKFFGGSVDALRRAAAGGFDAWSRARMAGVDLATPRPGSGDPSYRDVVLELVDAGVSARAAFVLIDDVCGAEMAARRPPPNPARVMRLALDRLAEARVAAESATIAVVDATGTERAATAADLGALVERAESPRSADEGEARPARPKRRRQTKTR